MFIIKFYYFPALPQGLTWAPLPGNFQSQTVFAQNPILIPSQQPHVFYQSPQNTMQMPASAVQTAMPATTYAITTNLPSRIRQPRASVIHLLFSL